MEGLKETNFIIQKCIPAFIYLFIFTNNGQTCSIRGRDTLTLSHNKTFLDLPGKYPDVLNYTHPICNEGSVINSQTQSPLEQEMEYNGFHSLISTSKLGKVVTKL